MVSIMLNGRSYEFRSHAGSGEVLCMFSAATHAARIALPPAQQGPISWWQRDIAQAPTRWEQTNKLIAMGFTQNAVNTMLESVNGDYNAALALLVSGSAPPASGAAASSTLPHALPLNGAEPEFMPLAPGTAPSSTAAPAASVASASSLEQQLLSMGFAADVVQRVTPNAADLESAVSQCLALSSPTGTGSPGPEAWLQGTDLQPPPALTSQNPEEGLAMFARLLTSEGSGLDVTATVSADLGAPPVHAECPICFEDLCAEPVATFFTSSGSRVCRHIFHAACCEDLGGTCPLCRREYDIFKTVPDPVEEPREWFSLIDVDGNGSLSKAEVAEALKATLPVDVSELDKHLEELWKRWDVAGDGELSFDEIMAPAEGLMAYLQLAKNPDQLRQSLSFRDPGPPPAPSAPPQFEASAPPPGTAAPTYNASSIPDIKTNRRAWFQFWDTDKGGSLDSSELFQALSASLGPSGVVVEKAMVEMLVSMCDTKGTGSIDEAEFLASGGLAETLIASLGL